MLDYRKQGGQPFLFFFGDHISGGLRKGSANPIRTVTLFWGGDQLLGYLIFWVKDIETEFSDMSGKRGPYSLKEWALKRRQGQLSHLPHPESTSA